MNTAQSGEKCEETVARVEKRKEARKEERKKAIWQTNQSASEPSGAGKGCVCV